MEYSNTPNGNQSTTQFFSIENSSNPQLGASIRQEIDILATKFIELDDHERSIKRDKKSIILELADKFERLHEIGEFNLPIDRIGARLYAYLQRKGIDISDRYIRQVLSENAPQYLNQSYQLRNSADNDIKIYQDEIMEAAQKLKNARYEMLTRAQFQELLSIKHETLDNAYDYADQHNITLEPTGIIEEPHYDSSELDPFADPVKTDMPDPRETPSSLALATQQLGDSIIDCGRTIKATGDMMMKYPPEEENKELEINAVKRVHEWKEFWTALTTALKSGTDRKYRRSIIQWMQIADTENDYGKHAASSKHPYMARFRDPKTGEWREEIRKLTREQIGEKAVKVREFSVFLRRVLPACIDFIKWSEICMFPYAAGLSTKLHDKLSDRSLR